MWLDQLNQEMGLTEQFYLEQTAEAQEFFGEEHQMALEARWKQKGYSGTFTQAMNEQICNFESLESPEAQEVLAFMVESFCEFTHREAPILNFFTDAENPGSCGYNTKDDQGREVIGINTKGIKFQGNFLAAVDTAMHELKHGRQDDLGMDFLAGKITPDHPDYIAARVFAANLKTRQGYIPPEVSQEAYQIQPVERDARYFGRMSAYLALARYGGEQAVANLRKAFTAITGGQSAEGVSLNTLATVATIHTTAIEEPALAAA